MMILLDYFNNNSSRSGWWRGIAANAISIDGSTDPQTFASLRPVVPYFPACSRLQSHRCRWWRNIYCHCVI